MDPAARPLFPPLRSAREDERTLHKSNQQMIRERSSGDSVYQTTALGPVLFSLTTSGLSKTLGVAVADRGSM